MKTGKCGAWKMKTHIKKLIQPFFDDVWDGKKMFELRKNDCDYKVDDFIILEEYDSAKDIYSGKNMRVLIKYILQDFEGLENGYCILGIEVFDRFDGEEYVFD